MPIVVHIQAIDGSAANWSDADDFYAIKAPNEVIDPLFVAWVEKGVFSCGFRVDASSEVVAATIATDAGECEVFRVVTAIEGLGENVVEGEDRCAACFRGVAVFTQEFLAFSDELASGAINGHGAWRIQR